MAHQSLQVLTRVSLNTGRVVELSGRGGRGGRGGEGRGGEERGGEGRRGEERGGRIT